MDPSTRDNAFRESLLRDSRKVTDYPPACPKCGGNIGNIFRCRTCFFPDVMCLRCMKSRHEGNPLHRIELARRYAPEWKLVDYDILTLRTRLGGHTTEAPCPNGDSVQKFKVIALDGVHHFWIVFCGCKGMSRVAQLEQVRLYAVGENPVEASTFEMARYWEDNVLVVPPWRGGEGGEQRSVE
ncbi:hypothetical protein R3P38DRAFT_3175415 [Favolaschia claudopus]|uniref:CxC2-like cysteine cluster KDZ transposase-associated domain-containing protein n=1 Tax=Favolaschia claudopus TaxID=2862362 RepID=A0AAW0DAK7_9AGAR